MLPPVVAALISRRAGQGQGTAMGLNNAFMSLGQVAGLIWAGFALDLNLYLPYLSGAVGLVLTLSRPLAEPAARRHCEPRR